MTTGLVNTASGSKLSISTASISSTTLEQADYEGLSWTELGEIEDAGSVGDTASDTSFDSLSAGRTRHYPGPFDAGTESVTCAFVSGDAGQEAVAAAFDSRLLYAFKLELTDRPDADHTNTIKYYAARVLSNAVNVGNAKNVVRKNFSLGINSAITTVQPTADTP